MYADDTQRMMHTHDTSENLEAQERINADTVQYCKEHQLGINPAKTEAIECNCRRCYN